MHPIVRVVLSVIFCSWTVNGQMRLYEDFESGPQPTLPPGWSVWNAAPFPIVPEANWTVRDTGQALPGLATATSRAHSGMRAVGVSWWAGVDTNTSQFLQADAWLITRRITNIQVGDSLVFWATGGNPSYLDSMQIWIGDADSTPASQVLQLGSIVWPVGSTYGLFRRYAYDVSVAAGIDIFVGFRYNQDVAIDGFFVHVDDVSVGPITSVPVNAEIPRTYQLLQNYPNPFNPSTTIEYHLPQSGFVRLQIFNILGQPVISLLNEQQTAGIYRLNWDATGHPSGVYYYQLSVTPETQTQTFREARKLLYVK